MNGDRYFVDSNVFLYTFDNAVPAKRARAESWISWLWENTCGVVSWQVLQELYWNALRKYGAPAEQLREQVQVLSEWRLPDVTIGLIERAWHWTDQAQVTFWDGLIVAAAERAKCRYLLSEDFQAERNFGSVTVLNPFKTSPPEVVANARPV